MATESQPSPEPLAPDDGVRPLTAADPDDPGLRELMGRAAVLAAKFRIENL